MSVIDPRQSHALIQEGFNSGNAEMMLDRYADDAILVLPSGDRLSGKQQLQNYLGQASNVIESVTIELVSLIELGDVALELTKSTAMVRGGQNGESVAMVGGSSVVLKRQPDGNWLIAIDVMGE